MKTPEPPSELPDEADTSQTGVELSLLGSFEIQVDGQVVPALAPEAQRLLGFLALRDRLVARSTVAGTLWPGASEARAYASLRSALGRLTVIARGTIVVTDTDLALAPEVVVDLRDGRALAHRLLLAEPVPAALDSTARAIRLLSTDCLVDWYDEWAVNESEEWRQLRLHALDALALRLAELRRFGDAIAAAQAAVRAEPLRESATAALIRVHLTEGNQSEALRSFVGYRTLLLSELGVEPTPALRTLLGGLLPT